MAGAVGLIPFGRAGAEGTFEIFDHLEPQPDGTVAVIYRDGLVRSVQPDGSVQTRGAGMIGPWEKAIVAGTIIAYYTEGYVYCFAFVPVVPNV